MTIGGTVNRVMRNSGANSRPLPRTVGHCLGRGCTGPNGIFYKIVRHLSQPMSKMIVFTGADGKLRHVGHLFTSRHAVAGHC